MQDGYIEDMGKYEVQVKKYNSFKQCECGVKHLHSQCPRCNPKSEILRLREQHPPSSASLHQQAVR